MCAGGDSGTSAAFAAASRTGDSATGLGMAWLSSVDACANASLRNELFDSERGRPLRLNPDELRRSIVPTLLSARRPVREGDGDAGRDPGVVGGEVAGGDAAEAMVRRIEWRCG